MLAQAVAAAGVQCFTLDEGNDHCLVELLMINSSKTYFEERKQQRNE